MENVMANLTNGTLDFRSGAEYVVLWASNLLADFFKYYHSQLNVSRRDVSIYTLILIVKNAIVCHGIYNMLPVSMSAQMLIAVSVYSALFFAGNFVLNFVLVWASFAAVFCLSSPVMTPFNFSFRFVMSIVVLLLAPIGYYTPCTVECAVDIFLAIHVTWFFLRSFWGPIDSLIEFYFSNVTAAVIISAADIFFETKGSIFVTVIISHTAISLILDAYRRRKVIYYVVMIILLVFCVHEQYLIFKNRPQIIPVLPTNIKVDLPVYPAILADEGE